MQIRMDESSVRAMRNRVFDHVISDTSWNAVRNNWMQADEMQFLRDHDFPLLTQHSSEYLKEHNQL